MRDNINVRHYWDVIKRRWLIVAFCIVAVTAISAAYSFVALARANNVIPVLSTQIMYLEALGYRPWMQTVAEMNQAMRDIAKNESVALIDFAHQMTWNEATFVDSCHLKDTPDGLGRKASIFADYLIQRRLIEQAAAQQNREGLEP